MSSYFHLRIDEGVPLHKLTQGVHYLAGPMSGIPQYNYPLFDAARDALTSRGVTVTSPADLNRQLYPDVENTDGYKDGTGEFDPTVEFRLQERRATIMHADLGAVVHCAAVVMLDGWEGSVGATMERRVAEHLGKPVYLLHEQERSGIQSFELVFDSEQQRLSHVAHRETMADGQAFLDAVQRHPSSVPIIGHSWVDTTVGHAATVAAPYEERVTHTSGGQKGRKLARFDLVPTSALTALAEHMGRNSDQHGGKYPERNWELGYPWSLNYQSAIRHLLAWWGGEDIDPDGFPHLHAALWHCAVLVEFAITHPENDDRPGGPLIMWGVNDVPA